MSKGSRVALSRLLSLVENHRESCDEILQKLSAKTGNAVRLGFTGPPGAGKSTLVTSYTKFLREQNKKVAILAVDPTSPFSGGALLGDRVRMNSVGLDNGVFIRSLATRGGLGGLSQAAGDMADVLDAFGFDVLIFETVGVGQSELEIAQYADTTVVVLVPESGDGIQAMKAGLMEIADLFVLNKADRDGSEKFASDLYAAMKLKEWGKWQPPVIMTVATRDKGIAEFDCELNRHIEYLKSTGEFESRRQLRLKKRIRRLVEESVVTDFWTEPRLKKLETAIRFHKSPYEIKQELFR